MCRYCTYEPDATEFRRGKVEISDFDEPRYRHSKRKNKTNPEFKTRPGCPGNDFKAHVYVWTTEYETRSFFNDYFGFAEYQSRVCVGCAKKNGRKHSQAYEDRKAKEWAKRFGTPPVMRGEPLSRWERRRGPRFKYYHWEGDIPEYVAKRREYMQRHGWNDYLYGRLY